MTSAILAIDAAERALARNGGADVWSTLYTVIEAFKMRDDWEWTKKYYSGEAREQLERLRDTSEELIERGEHAWARLLAEVEEAASQGLDPSSEAARALAMRWRDLLAQFTQGNAEIAQGLNRLWSDSAHWPNGFARPWSDAAEAFIKKAMDPDSHRS